MFVLFKGVSCIKSGIQEDRGGGRMSCKTIVLWGLTLIFMTSTIAAAGDWAGKPAIGIRGPLWIPYDDIAGPEPFRMGIDASLFFKYGVTRNFVLDLSGGYISTYDDTSATDDANLKFMKKDLAERKLNGILVGLTGNFYFMPTKKIQPYLLAGVGVDMWKIKPVDGGGDDIGITDFGAKAGLGVNFWLSENVTLDVQAKMTYEISNLSADEVPGTDFSDWDQREFRGYIEPSIGLTYVIGRAPDTDEDGVKDSKDNCPYTPMGAVVDEYGCPLDGDGDGVYDGLDICPDTPRGAAVDAVGCPIDSDKDGVYDGIDRCPDTPAGAQVDIDGCPEDADGDGVYNGLDKCPDTQQGCKVDADGCMLDGDGDGVCDGLDRCPSTAPGVKIDANGCPVEVKPPVQKISLNIKYKTGSYEPDDNAKQVLDELIKTMKAYTGTVIEINGFTDDVGRVSSNQVLSEKRAEGVRNYLVRGGVEPERITTKGFGEDPNFFVGDNKTPEGRQKNRRVEIISIER
jgi:outer membrane protein OmpA-like peptidoglycan-associated protein/opacity protein-like surface antigen